MTVPNDPTEPGYEDPVVVEPQIVPPAAGEQMDAPVTATEPRAGTSPAAPSGTSSAPVASEQVDDSEEDSGGKLKAGALLAGAVAVANKVRQKAPAKVQEIREKRAAGRCVILTEFGGRSVAIGPYRDAEAARQATMKVAGAPRVVDLVSEKAFFAPLSTE